MIVHQIKKYIEVASMCPYLEQKTTTAWKFIPHRSRIEILTLDSTNVLFTLNGTTRSSVLILCVVRFDVNKMLYFLQVREGHFLILTKPYEFGRKHQLEWKILTVEIFWCVTYTYFNSVITNFLWKPYFEPVCFCIHKFNFIFAGSFSQKLHLFQNKDYL